MGYDLTNAAAEVKSATGLVYEPWALGETIGYRIWHPSGAVQYIYFHPSGDSDDGVDNVFVYRGAEGDPAVDEPLCHFDIDQI